MASGNGRVCGSAIEELRLSVAAGRPCSAAGESGLADSTRMTSLSHVAGRSRNSGFLCLGGEDSSWPELGPEAVQQVRTTVRPAKALDGSVLPNPKCLSAPICDVASSGLVDSVGHSSVLGKKRISDSGLEEMRPIRAAGRSVLGDRSSSAKVKAVPVSVSADFGLGAADAGLAAVDADLGGPVCAADLIMPGSDPMSSSGEDDVSSKGDEMNFSDGNARRSMVANSLCKPFGFGLADLANDELRSMVTGATTYADMLRSQSPFGSWADDVEEDLFTDADASYIPGQCGLNLKFSKRVLDALDRNWRYAVIVNLMGKPSSKNVFEFVLRGLRRKWLSKGCWKLIDLPKDYFVVNFELEEDMLKALCDGPWVLGGHTLVVRRWCATFNPLTDVVRSMAVWARVEGLPLRYFTDFAMTKIGKLIGEEVVKVDDVTTQKVRGCYGRVCVEIDLNKPFKSIIEVEDVLYKVRYEGLDHLCFKCGMYGHVNESCMVGKVQMEVDSEGCEGPSGPACEGGNRNKVEESKVVAKEVVDEGFGPWMIMDYKNKKRNGKVSETKPMSLKGSRFSVLDVQGDAWPPKTAPDASFAMAITPNPKPAPAKSNLSKGTNDPVIDNEKIEVVLDLVREEVPSVIPRAPPRDLRSASSSKTKGSIKRSKSSLKLSSKSMVSKARGPPPTPHPSRRLVAESYDRSEGAFQGSHGRSPSEKAGVTTEVPSLENGVKGIVAQFEGTDVTPCRDSSFPFCSSSHAG